MFSVRYSDIALFLDILVSIKRRCGNELPVDKYYLAA